MLLTRSCASFTRGICSLMIISKVAAIAIQTTDQSQNDPQPLIPHKEIPYVSTSACLTSLNTDQIESVSSLVHSPNMAKRAPPDFDNYTYNEKPPVPPKPSQLKKTYTGPDEEIRVSNLVLSPPEEKSRYENYENWPVSHAPRPSLRYKDAEGTKRNRNNRNSFWEKFRTAYPTLYEVRGEIYDVDERMFMPVSGGDTSDPSGPVPRGLPESDEPEFRGTGSNMEAESEGYAPGMGVESEGEVPYPEDESQRDVPNMEDESQREVPYKEDESQSEVPYTEDESQRKDPVMEEDFSGFASAMEAQPEAAPSLSFTTSYSDGMSGVSSHQTSELPEIQPSELEPADLEPEVSDSDQENHDYGGPRKFRVQAVVHDSEISKNPTSSRKPPIPPLQMVGLDIGAVTIQVAKVEPGQTGVRYPHNRQTATFIQKSCKDSSFAVGVADALVGDERSVGEYSNMPEELCHRARSYFENASPHIRAPGLLDEAYRKILRNEQVVTAACAASFGIISPDGKASISAMKNSGVVWFRDNKVHRVTFVKDHPEGEPYVTVVDAVYNIDGSHKMRHVFYMFTDKSDYEWDTQRGDVLLFASGDISKYSKAKDLPDLMREYPQDTAEEIAAKFSQRIVKKIRSRQKRARTAVLCDCFPCLRSTEQFPTDVSVVVVKVT